MTSSSRLHASEHVRNVDATTRYKVFKIFILAWVHIGKIYERIKWYPLQEDSRILKIKFIVYGQRCIYFRTLV